MSKPSSTVPVDRNKPRRPARVGEDEQTGPARETPAAFADAYLRPRYCQQPGPPSHVGNAVQERRFCRLRFRESSLDQIRPRAAAKHDFAQPGKTARNRVLWVDIQIHLFYFF